ncbi:PspA/IM30 family protein [Isoptericola sp. b441]|uniref:PspA/IM30 family protein n=1 Tax=Actinotalea lenta TaxID=3064654 RepID=A0ABT9DEN0_9CELL|nr:PspA/IM30 family protein [Isoptericola sp. b441]MDO8107607.1 PspA/IM30 family protein [Isoptericola sp. b441]
MADKRTVLGRISQLARANINALLDRTEDPGTMIDQLIRDYTNTVVEAQDAVAQTIGNLRLAEQDHAADVAAASEWGRKALAASSRADRLRAAGNAADADRFDDLAKAALGKQITAERDAAAAEPMIASQADAVERLKSGLSAMKDRLAELQTRRDSLVARQKSAEAQAKIQGAFSAISVLDPTSELSRFEDKVRHEEAYAAGRAEVATSSLEAQFDELERSGDDLEVEARLAALKNPGA